MFQSLTLNTLFAGQVESNQQNSGGGSDRDDLLSAIRKGAQLKSVSICFY